MILFVGGGAAIMGDEMAKEFGKGLIPNEPDLAIARGIEKVIKRAGQ